MQITKLEHSGLIITKNDQNLVFDPVEFTSKVPEINQVSAIIITHKHNDHFQPEVITKILNQNPTARLFATIDLEIDSLADHPIEKVEANVVWDLDNFHLRFFGQDHASIIPDVVPCRNLGVIIDEIIVNPGDSFDSPTLSDRPKVLFVPSAAPWCKVIESMNYLKEIKPEIAIPVHDAVLSELGQGFHNSWLSKAADEVGTKLVPLKPGESVEIN